MLDLHRARLVYELGRLGSVTAVAEALNYTHSAVSQQLMQCEREVGVKLYEKAGRGVRLTEQGQVLAEYAVKLIALADEAQAAVLASTSQVRGKIRVTSFQTVLSSVLPQALTELEAMHPQLRVEVVQSDIEAATLALANRSVDLILGEEYGPDIPTTDQTMHREVLIRDPMYLITPTEGPWSRLEFPDLESVPFAIDPPHLAVGRFVQQLARRYGFSPTLRYQSPDPFLHVHLVRTGHAVSVVPELFLPLADAVRVVALPENPARTLYTAVLAGRENHPALAAFRASLRKAIESTL